MIPRPNDRWSDKELRGWMRGVAERFAMGEFEWDPPSVPANSTVDTTLTSASLPILGVIKQGCAVTSSPQSALTAGIVIGGAWSTTDGSLTIRLGNVTAAPIDPGSATWSFLACIP